MKKQEHSFVKGNTLSVDFLITAFWYILICFFWFSGWLYEVKYVRNTQQLKTEEFFMSGSTCIMLREKARESSGCTSVLCSICIKNAYASICTPTEERLEEVKTLFAVLLLLKAVVYWFSLSVNLCFKMLYVAIMLSSVPMAVTFIVTKKK